MANNFYERLAKTKGGVEKIRRLRKKSGFNLDETFFKMHTFRALKDLSENHDEILRIESYISMISTVPSFSPI